MKKLFVLMMALVLCFSLVACTINVNSDKKDDDKDDKTTEASTDTADDSGSAADTDEDSAVDYELPEYYNEIVEYIELAKELTNTDIPMDICAGCEEDNDMADKDIILCSSCIAAENCINCDEQLPEDQIFICEDCLAESYTELNEYAASLEENEVDVDYSDEFAEYYLSLEEFVQENMPDDVVEGECVNCGAETGSFIFCDDCIKTTECVFCGTEVEKYEAVICTDCFDALKSEY